MKFKVGDKLTGNNDAYGVTNTKMKLGVVTEVNNESNMVIRIVEHDDVYWVGKEYYCYNVKDDEFTILNELPKTETPTSGDYSVDEGVLADYITIGNITIAIPTGTPYGISKFVDDAEIRQALALTRMISNASIKGLI